MSSLIRRLIGRDNSNQQLLEEIAKQQPPPEVGTVTPIEPLLETDDKIPEDLADLLWGFRVRDVPLSFHTEGDLRSMSWASRQISDVMYFILVSDGGSRRLLREKLEALRPLYESVNAEVYAYSRAKRSYRGFERRAETTRIAAYRLEQGGG